MKLAFKWQYKYSYQAYIYVCEILGSNGDERLSDYTASHRQRQKIFM
jgi:hypothetical protein